MRPARRCRSAFATAVVCALVTLFGGAHASAQPEHKRALLIYDEDKTLPGLSVLDQALRSSLSADDASIEFFTESMNLSQFNDEHYEQVLAQHYANKYRARKPDLIIAVIGPALGFLLRHGDRIFPGVPIVFCGADAADIEGVTIPAHVTGILVRRVFAPTLDVVLQLQPETRQVFVVGGTSTFDRHLQAQARREFRASEQRVSIEYLTELSMDDLLATVSRLPAQSAILYVTLFRDGAGRAHVPHEVVSRLSSVANAPVFIFVDQYLGRGAVGGHLYSLERHGKSAAEVGRRVLRGESPATIPVQELTSTANMFDARVLTQWNLDERRLPPDSIVLFREPGLWDRYRLQIIGGVALLVAQTALIGGLLLQRARRRRTEAELRASYQQIRNLGGRLLRAQETERAHLARELHDDISQQMAVLEVELRVLMNRRGSESLRDPESLLAETSARVATVTRSLRDLSHRLHPAHLRLLGLTVALERLQRELSTNDVAIAFTHEGVPKVLSPDVMVCLYRVAQEAVSNAVKHGCAGRVSVHLRGSPDRITMMVADNGVGFDVRAAHQGLGLISMRERVEQIGGSLQVSSEPGRGARLEVEVPYTVSATAEAV